MDFTHLAAPFVGGAALEVVYWWQLREQHQEPKYQALMRSVAYWVPTIAMIAIGAVVALYWAISKEDLPSPFEMLVAGAAAPSLLKNGFAASLKNDTDLGDEDQPAPRFRDYFLPGD